MTTYSPNAYALHMMARMKAERQRRGWLLNVHQRKAEIPIAVCPVHGGPVVIDKDNANGSKIATCETCLEEALEFQMIVRRAWESEHQAVHVPGNPTRAAADREWRAPARKNQTGKVGSYRP